MYHNDGSLVIVPLWKAPMTREKYRGRLAKFFDFIGLTEGTMEEQATVFTEKGKKDPG